MYNKKKYYKETEVDYRITKDNAGIYENNLNKLIINREITEIVPTISEVMKITKLQTCNIWDKKLLYQMKSKA